MEASVSFFSLGFGDIAEGGESTLSEEPIFKFAEVAVEVLFVTSQASADLRVPELIDAAVPSIKNHVFHSN